MAKSNAALGERPRRIAHRTYGRRPGPITRLMSPSDLGEILKPFVFLDLFDTEGGSFEGFGLHPHSGIATLTYLLEGSVRYEDTTGATGILPEGGVEWFKAGHGAWHGGAGVRPDTRFQPGSRCAPANSGRPGASTRRHRTLPDWTRFPLLGKLGAVSSRFPPPSSLTYWPCLKAGESLALRSAGRSHCLLGRAGSGNLAVPEGSGWRACGLRTSNEAARLHAAADTEFVLGSAASHQTSFLEGTGTMRRRRRAPPNGASPRSAAAATGRPFSRASEKEEGDVGFRATPPEQDAL